MSVGQPEGVGAPWVPRDFEWLSRLRGGRLEVTKWCWCTPPTRLRFRVQGRGDVRAVVRGALGPTVTPSFMTRGVCAITAILGNGRCERHSDAGDVGRGGLPRPCVGYSSVIFAEISRSIQPWTLLAAGHFVACVATARSAFSRVPAGIRRSYCTRIRVMRSTLSMASMSPSTRAWIFSFGAGISRTSSARASVPSSQPPTAPTM